MMTSKLATYLERVDLGGDSFEGITFQRSSEFLGPKAMKKPSLDRYKGLEKREI